MNASQMRHHRPDCTCRWCQHDGKRSHGESGARSPEYVAWQNMRARCNNPNNPRYGGYGGRGITICERWASFENFLADMGRRPGPGWSIDRIDNDGNYEPGNCRWTTADVQQRHRQRDELGRLT